MLFGFFDLVCFGLLWFMQCRMLRPGWIIYNISLLNFPSMYGASRTIEISSSCNLVATILAEFSVENSLAFFLEPTQAPLVDKYLAPSWFRVLIVNFVVVMFFVFWFGLFWFVMVNAV
jgi:hypothetical protein